MEEIYKSYLSSGSWLLEITASDKGIKSVNFLEEMPEDRASGANAHSEANLHTEMCLQQLNEYFRGERKDFDLKLSPEGTPFQIRVWQELMKIPYGTTISYLQLAERLGDPLAVRAVGGANGKNKIAIIIPCHRVIGGSGKLTGYAGGLSRKMHLLELERKYSGDDLRLF